jgi:hypothetical protein
MVIGLLAVLVGCLSLVGLVNQMTGDAVSQALNDNAPGNAQRVTAVCVGLNIGSCRTNQTSTATQPGSADSSGTPWPLKLLAVAVVTPLLLGGIVWSFSRTEEW